MEIKLGISWAVRRFTHIDIWGVPESGFCGTKCHSLTGFRLMMDFDFYYDLIAVLIADAIWACIMLALEPIQNEWCARAGQ